MAIGIIEAANGAPVRQDASGADAEVKTGPYLLSDGVSLLQPIPVVVVGGNSYVDDAGNLRAVWPLNISGLNEPPVNLTSPVITGDNAVDETLAVSDGTWSGNPAPTFTYQWQVSTDASIWADILGETGATYDVVADDLAKFIRCIVTATNSEGSESANSNIAGPVE